MDDLIQNNSRAFSRRRMLALSGSGLALAALSYCNMSEGPLDFVFLESQKGSLGDLMELTVPSRTESLPEMIQADLKGIFSDPAVMDAWAKLHGGAQSNLEIIAATKASSCIPERDERVGKSYAAYVARVIPYALRMCGLPKIGVRPIIARGPASDLRDVLIVNTIGDSYSVFFELSDSSNHRLQWTRGGFLEEGHQGRASMQVRYEGNGVIMFDNHNIMLATVGEKASLFDGPAAEILHRAINKGTQKYISDLLLREPSASIGRMEELGKAGMLYEEGLAHAASFRVIKKFADDFKLPYTADEQQERVRFLESQPAYIWVPAARKLLDKEGFTVLTEYCDAPSNVVRKLESLR